MAHIKLPEGLPGIRGPMAYRQDTGRVLSELADVLLRSEGTLTPAERELIAAHVSAENDCTYCHSSHGAIAAYYLDDDEALVAEVKRDPQQAAITPKLKSLLAVAGRVARGGKHVRAEDIERARRDGASDREIHDTVLIAAAFCMYNRYVDGLATWTADDPVTYRERAAMIAKDGYLGVASRYMAATAAAKAGAGS